jgi:phage tail sheath gpL-like
MAISGSSLAAGVGVRIRNENFSDGAAALPRKLLILAQKRTGASAVEGAPFLITSPADAADKCGAGGMAHRLALAAWRGHGGSVPTYMLIENLAGGAAQTRTLTVTAANAAAGTLSLYVCGKLYEIAVAAAATAAGVAASAAAALTADSECPFTATVAAGAVTLTAKDLGVYGKTLTVDFNVHPELGEAFPGGVTVALGNGTNGSGVPNVAADLVAGLGSGDGANEAGFTDVVTGYGGEAAVLNALSQYVGEGQADVGLYADAVARPFRSLYADAATGSAGLQAAMTKAAGRLNDRCNGVVCRPGSLTPPAEIAAEVLARCAMINQTYPGKPYVGQVASGVDIGAEARATAGADWTTDYANQDLAVKSGVGFLLVKGGAATLSNIVSHFRPASIPVESNAYREFANVSKIQNILWNTMRTFQSVKWQGFIVVQDVANVGWAQQRNECRDVPMVKATLLGLVDGFYDLGLLFEKQFSVDYLKTDAAVQLRPGGDGFSILMKYKLSGVGNIIDTTVAVDTRVA